MAPKTVHAWEISGYGKVKKRLRDSIRNGLKKKYGSLHKAEIKLRLSDYYHRRLHETFTRKDILFRLIKEAGINKYQAEKDIIKWKDAMPQEGYEISFPIKPNIIHIRIISHLIGDGTIGSNYTWCQKNVTPLRNLQKKLFAKNFKHRKNVITIPKILVKIVSQSLRIKLKTISKRELIEKLVSLPKKYKIQVLTALIEDEGTCDKNRIIIRMNDKNIMKSIVHIIDSLGYTRSNLTKQYYKRYGIKKEIWRVDLNIEGIKQYWKNLNKAEKKHGKLLGLWKKREAVKKLSTHKANVRGWRRNKELRTEILKSGRFKNIYFDAIRREFDLTNNETMSLLRYLVNKKDIKKISKGVYETK